MSRPRVLWWRFYCEMLRDPKIRLRPLATRWAWLAVLTIARESPEPGFLIVVDEVMTIPVLADLAAISVKEAQAAYDYFLRTGLVELDRREIPFAVTFLERQYESDTSTVRTARKRAEEQLKTVLKNGKESDQGTGSSSVSMSSVSLDIQEDGGPTDFDRFWAIFPRHEAKGAARKAFASALRRADVETILAGAQRYRDDPNLPDEARFIPHPTTWLNQDRWEDDPLPPRSPNPASRAGDRNRETIARSVERARRVVPNRPEIEAK